MKIIKYVDKNKKVNICVPPFRNAAKEESTWESSARDLSILMAKRKIDLIRIVSAKPGPWAPTSTHHKIRELMPRLRLDEAWENRS